MTTPAIPTMAHIEAMNALGTIPFNHPFDFAEIVRIVLEAAAPAMHAEWTTQPDCESVSSVNQVPCEHKRHDRRVPHEAHRNGVAFTWVDGRDTAFARGRRYG